MAKNGDLWDDSALINALNDAVSNYKKMHGKKEQDRLPDENKFTTSTGENGSENHDAIREAEKNDDVVLNTESDLGDNKNPAPVKETNLVEPPEISADLSNSVLMTDAQGVQSSEYNQLLTQYYDLEEKRQNILVQLNQYGDWSYQFATESSGNNNFSYYPVSTCPPDVVNSCCQYVCEPCTIPGCSSSCGPCIGDTRTDTNVAMGPGNSQCAIDGDIIKTAMGAAEKAISSMKLKSFVHPDSTREKEEKKEGDKQMTEDVSSETNLSVVLKAWYSAGFYTGKITV